MSKAKIGYIGVGLMGHGAAKNIVEKGYPLTIMGHRNRAPVEDLVKRGAKEGKSAAEVARASDVLFLCLPSSVEVEATVYGSGGVLEGAHAGLIVVDQHDRRSELDAPHRRRSRSAGVRACSMRRSGARRRRPRRASSAPMWAAIPTTAKAVRPVMECYADTIVEVGALGMGHTMKLINNFISIGTCAVIAEATATAAKLGVDMRKFYEVISAGGANSRMFQMVMPWVLEGDDSHLKGPLRIAGKDMRFYTRLAEQAPAAAFIAQAVNQTLHLCNMRGHGDRFLPVLPGLLADLNGAKIHDL